MPYTTYFGGQALSLNDMAHGHLSNLVAIFGVYDYGKFRHVAIKHRFPF